jgi:hypothetical protein
MRFDLLYSIYLIFAVACIVRQLRLAWRTLRDGAAAEGDAR